MSMFINPNTKFGFNRIFGQEEHRRILIDFLNAVFENKYHIENVDYQDTSIITGSDRELKVIHNLFCSRDDGTPLILEVQNRDIIEAFSDRVLYFLSKAIVAQGDTLDNWKSIPLFVGILGFTREDLGKQFRYDAGMTPHIIRMPQVSKPKGPDAPPKELFHITFLQMPYFNKSECECETSLDKWCFILKNMSSLKQIPWAEQHDVFAELAQVAMLDALTHEERSRYDASCEELAHSLSETV